MKKLVGALLVATAVAALALPAATASAAPEEIPGVQPPAPTATTPLPEYTALDTHWGD